MNLLKETQCAIEDSGHNINDIVFIGSEESGHSCTWNEFVELANKDYDSGFGSQKVAHDLVIVFSDNQKMWRSEYDGSECWAFSKSFKKPAVSKPIKSLFTHRVGWDSLEEIDEQVGIVYEEVLK